MERLVGAGYRKASMRSLNEEKLIPRKKSGSTTIERRLEALRKALKQASPPSRRTALEACSAALRRELLRYVEALVAKGEAATLQSGKPKKRRPPAAGIWAASLPSGHVYAARLSVGGIAMASCTTRCSARARAFRDAIQQISSSVVSDERCDPPPNAAWATFAGRLRDAVATAVSAEPHLGLRFHIVLDARPWIGKRVYSPALESVESALALRRAVDDAALRGWPVLRGFWLEWLMAQRRRLKCQSAAEAEAAAGAVEAAFKAKHQVADAAPHPLTGRLFHLVSWAERALEKANAKRQRQRRRPALVKATRRC